MMSSIVSYFGCNYFPYRTKYPYDLGPSIWGIQRGDHVIPSSSPYKANKLINLLAAQCIYTSSGNAKYDLVLKLSDIADRFYRMKRRFKGYFSVRSDYLEGSDYSDELE